MVWQSIVRQRHWTWFPDLWFHSNIQSIIRCYNRTDYRRDLPDLCSHKSQESFSEKTNLIIKSEKTEIIDLSMLMERLWQKIVRRIPRRTHLILPGKSNTFQTKNQIDFRTHQRDLNLWSDEGPERTSGITQLIMEVEILRSLVCARYWKKYGTEKSDKYVERFFRFQQ